MGPEHILKSVFSAFFRRSQGVLMVVGFWIVDDGLQLNFVVLKFVILLFVVVSEQKK